MTFNVGAIFTLNECKNHCSQFEEIGTYLLDRDYTDAIPCIFIYYLHACKSWASIAEFEKRMHVSEMRCCLKVLDISYNRRSSQKDPSTNLRIWRTVLIMVKEQKLNLSNHISRSSGLTRTMLKDTVKRKKKDIDWRGVRYLLLNTFIPWKYKIYIKNRRK